MPEINQAYLALIGALMGGSGLKFVESWLNRSKVKDDAASAFRNELRDEVKNLRDELRSVEAEVEKWRQKYYETYEQLIAANSALEVALRKDKPDD
jgi:uncharacterized coiled-coil DUF342 family protein